MTEATEDGCDCERGVGGRALVAVAVAVAAGQAVHGKAGQDRAGKGGAARAGNRRLRRSSLGSLVVAQPSPQ